MKLACISSGCGRLPNRACIGNPAVVFGAWFREGRNQPARKISISMRAPCVWAAVLDINNKLDRGSQLDYVSSGFEEWVCKADPWSSQY